MSTIIDPRRMSADEFRNMLDSFDLTHSSAAFDPQGNPQGLPAFLACSERTARNWCRLGPPVPVAVLLRVMAFEEMDPREVLAVCRAQMKEDKQ